MPERIRKCRGIWLAACILLITASGCHRKSPHNLEAALVSSLNAGESLLRCSPPPKPGLITRYSGELGETAELINAGNPDDALAKLDALALSDSGVPAIFYLRSMAYLQKVRDAADAAIRSEWVNRAEMAAEKATELSPNSAEFWVQRARATLTAGKKRYALDFADTARDCDPLSPEIAWRTGTIYLECEYPEAALKALEFAVSESPFNPRYLLTLGYYYSTLPEPDHWKAIKYYRKAVDACEKSDPVPKKIMADALNNLGGTLRLMHRPAEALDAYDRAIALSPEHVRAHLGRARVLINHDNVRTYNRTEALKAALEAVKITEGKDARALAMLSRAYYENNDYAAAADRIRIALELDPCKEYRKLLDGYERAVKTHSRVKEIDEIIP